MSLIDLLHLLVTGLVGLSSQGGKPAGFWMPRQGSTVAPMVDDVFWFIMVVSIFFFVAIVVDLHQVFEDRLGDHHRVVVGLRGGIERGALREQRC